MEVKYIGIRHRNATLILMSCVVEIYLCVFLIQK